MTAKACLPMNPKPHRASAWSACVPAHANAAANSVSAPQPTGVRIEAVVPLRQ
jgi:hypothetical protein